MSISEVWRGVRYWVQDPTGDQHQGWNTRFVVWPVIRETNKKIIVRNQGVTIHLDRRRFFAVGKFRHGKSGEWFYLDKPLMDPEKVRDIFYVAWMQTQYPDIKDRFMAGPSAWRHLHPDERSKG